MQGIFGKSLMNLRLHGFYGVLIALLILSGIAQAQDSGTPERGNHTIHIVQRDETLAQIAQRYDTSVELLMTINNLTDERFIQVGQRLLIPDANPGLYTAQVGETLVGIALKHGVAVEQLAGQNHILHPSRLYAGQSLHVPDTTSINYYYVVQPGDTLARIAAAHSISLTQLQVANDLLTLAVIPGQLLTVPQSTTSTAFIDLPSPLVNLSLNPMIPVQGQSISLQFETQTPVEASGVFMARSFQAGVIEGNHYGAILGVHAMTEPGIYTLTLLLDRENASSIYQDFRVWVTDGNYGSEVITIPPERQYLLDSEIVEAELDRVLDVMQDFTPQHYFGGLMALPVASTVTSPYGTRRSYNGSPYNTFHGGTDFGGSVGIPITAPADGVVVLADELQVRGNAVIIDHGWGVYSGYWHQSEIYVQVGQMVSKGETIGALGGTGLSTGAHLHWELWVHGVQVDPMQWVQQAFP